jgi:hypothetical protein
VNREFDGSMLRLVASVNSWRIAMIEGLKNHAVIFAAQANKSSLWTMMRARVKP